MPTQKTWVSDPDSGGVKIPAAVKQDVLKRIHAAADEHLPPGLYTRLDIRFKAQFCYIDDIQSYATNEIAINWNAGLSWVASFVADLDNGANDGD